MSSHVYTAQSVDNPKQTISCEINDVTMCPICHVALDPRIIDTFYKSTLISAAENAHKYTVYQLAFCPKCREAFFAKYRAIPRPSAAGLALQALSTVELSPSTPVKSTFSKAIQELSPMFVSTYNQSEVAEASNLTEIAGCGYRKSVEFLVKDYLCHKFPDDEVKIKSEFLGTAIQRIDDHRIKTLTERATWIGNDETHYIRKHESLDITDMKRFISAVLPYIESELTFEEALSVSKS